MDEYEALLNAPEAEAGAMETCGTAAADGTFGRASPRHSGRYFGAWRSATPTTGTTLR